MEADRATLDYHKCSPADKCRLQESRLALQLSEATTFELRRDPLFLPPHALLHLIMSFLTRLLPRLRSAPSTSAAAVAPTAFPSFSLLSQARAFSSSPVAALTRKPTKIKLKTHKGAAKRWIAIANGNFKRVSLTYSSGARGGGADLSPSHARFAYRARLDVFISTYASDRSLPLFQATDPLILLLASKNTHRCRRLSSTLALPSLHHNDHH